MSKCNDGNTHMGISDSPFDLDYSSKSSAEALLYHPEKACPFSLTYSRSGRSATNSTNT